MKRILAILLIVSGLGSRGSGLGAVREAISLDGQWDFRLVQGPNGELGTGNGNSLPSALNPQSSTLITVPGNWELQGFGEPIYGGNKQKNEYGIYKRSFDVPETWADKDLFLRTDGVQFGYRLYIDGAYVGEWTSSFNRKEWPLDLKPGKHEVVIETLNRPRGWGFDTYDDWVLSGIFRSVTLLARPKTRIEDWKIETKGDEAIISAKIAGEGTLRATLGEQTLEGNPIAIPIDGMLRWTAEAPNLYDLKLELVDGDDVLDVVEARVGLREIAWKDGVLKLNGMPIKLRGVNHHDLSPEHGRAITVEEELADVKMIKAANCNFIRLCHYPPRVEMLDICDELGVYVLDEVPFGFGEKNLDDPTFEADLIERADATIARDKNHACVIGWSVGNENKLTPICEATGAHVAALDPSRPYCFPQIPSRFKDMLTNGVPETVGLLDWHYPSAEGLEEYAPLFKKPFIASEFAHALGLAFAGLEPVWAKMQATPSIAGGAIWMFQDQGIRRNVKCKIENVKSETKGSAVKGKKSAAEIDTGTWVDENTLLDTCAQAGTDGIVYSDRTPQTDYYETKAVYSPVQLGDKVISPKAGPRKFKIPVENRYDFTDLSALKCEWRLLADCAVLDSGEMVFPLAPHENGELLIRSKMPTPEECKATSYRLEVAFKDPSGVEVCRKCYPIWDRVSGLGYRVSGMVNHTEAQRFSALLARVSRRETMNIRATTTTPRAVSKEHTIWSPNVLEPSNSVAIANGFSALFTPDPLPPNPPRKDGKPPKPRPSLGDLKGEFAFEGDLFSYSLTPSRDWETVEAGVSVPLKDMRRIRWLGEGPYEEYPGAAKLDMFGIWKLDRDDIYFPGCRMNCRALVIDDGKGNGYLVTGAHGESFPFAVERTEDGGILFSHLATVSGTFSKYVWPTDVKKIPAGTALKGSFKIVRINGDDWSEAMVSLFGKPDEEIKPFNPFFRSYDQ